MLPWCARHGSRDWKYWQIDECIGGCIIWSPAIASISCSKKHPFAKYSWSIEGALFVFSHARARRAFNWNVAAGFTQNDVTNTWWMGARAEGSEWSSPFYSTLPATFYNNSKIKFWDLVSLVSLQAEGNEQTTWGLCMKFTTNRKLKQVKNVCFFLNLGTIICKWPKYF